MFKSCLLISLFVVAAYCDDLQDLTKNIKNQVGLEAYDTRKEKVLEIIHQKCLKNSDEATYLEVKNGREEVFKCVNRLINVEQLNKEIEAAKPQGTLDEVFKTYCDKIPQFKTCTETYGNKLKRCLSEKERETAAVGSNIFNKLTEFVCFKDGDRIAMFIAEGGPQCLQSKTEQIQKCANSTMPASFNPSSIDVNNVPEFSFEKENCDKITTFQHCIVTELETCADPTTANMVDSLIKFILDATPCKKVKA